MDINLLFKIAAIGILVAVLHQVLVRAGREDQAMMTTLARFSYSFNNGNKRNKHFVWNSKNNIQFIKIAEGMKKGRNYERDGRQGTVSRGRTYNSGGINGIYADGGLSGYYGRTGGECHPPGAGAGF